MVFDFMYGEVDYVYDECSMCFYCVFVIYFSFVEGLFECRYWIQEGVEYLVDELWV